MYTEYVIDKWQPTHMIQVDATKSETDVCMITLYLSAL